jgi:hypothetical protein
MVNVLRRVYHDTAQTAILAIPWQGFSKVDSLDPVLAVWHGLPGLRRSTQARQAIYNRGFEAGLVGLKPPQIPISPIWKSRDPLVGGIPTLMNPQSGSPEALWVHECPEQDSTQYQRSG